MKLFSFLAILLFASLLAVAQGTPKGLAVNTKAPAFSATDQNGNKVTLSDLLKKGPVVVVFFVSLLQ